MITRQEAIEGREFHAGQCIKTVGPRGGVKISQEVWRRNGKTQQWKTRPEDFRLPVKFGLYGYAQITPANAIEVHLADSCPINAYGDNQPNTITKFPEGEK